MPPSTPPSTCSRAARAGRRRPSPPATTAAACSLRGSSEHRDQRGSPLAHRPLRRRRPASRGRTRPPRSSSAPRPRKSTRTPAKVFADRPRHQRDRPALLDPRGVGEAESTFDLLIPSVKARATRSPPSRQSARSLSRTSRPPDITAPTIGVGERLQDAEASVEGLLGQLAAAESDAEREVVEAELRFRAPAGRRPALPPLLAAAARPTSRASRCGSRPARPARSAGGGWGVGDALR